MVASKASQFNAHILVTDVIGEPRERGTMGQGYISGRVSC